jgi:hypothetical protein
LIIVYHNQNPFAMLGDLNHRFSREDNWIKVAEVDTDSLEDAYEVTQNFEQPWTINSQVRAESGNHRSTAVGDVFELNEKRYKVSAQGFMLM